MIVNMSVEIPDWVRWMSTDSDGEVYGWSSKPYEDFSGRDWYDSKVHDVVYICVLPPPADWTKELYKVVEGELVRVEEMT